MRTDDFDDITPEDTNDPRPDRETIDVETGESFNEFDQPAAQGGSLGEIWRNNPIIKLAVVGVGVVAVVAGLIIFGGGSGEAPKSTVGTAVNESEAPGGPTSEAYRDALNDVNEQRIEQALREGTSSIPIPTAGSETVVTDPVQEEPPVTLDDPLASWRASVQQPSQDTATGVTGPTPTLDPNSQVYQQQPQAMGPDPAAVDALAQAMNAQMAAILDKHKINGPQVMQVTDKSYFTPEDAEGDGGDTVPVTEEVEEILIPAATIVYAQMLTEANSDVPGPVLARISSGPLTGSRVLGTFANTEDYLTLRFDQVVVNGVSRTVDAIALDPKTTLPAVATDVNRRYFRRFILPAAAQFIEGMGDAIAQREQTNVSVNGSTVTSSTPDLGTREELAAGFAEGTRSISEDLDREGEQIKAEVKVRAGTPIGILFLEPVLKEE